MLKPLTSALLKHRRAYPERIVQFGGGNFLRGFVDWVVDILNDETDFAGSIALVKATPGRYDDLDAQDCLFTTWLHGVTGDEFIERTRLITAVNRHALPLSRLRCLSHFSPARRHPLHLLQHHRIGHRLFRGRCFP